MTPSIVPEPVSTAAETIDGLTSLDLPRRGAIAALQAEARRLVGEALALAAAREALARTPDGAVVAISHGLPGISLDRPRSGREGGGDDAIDMMHGWGDVEFVAIDHGVPTIYYGPGTVAAAHTADEYIELDRYHAGVAVYERAIRTFLTTA